MRRSIVVDRAGYVDELRSDHRLVNVDLRGHGASDKPHEADAYTSVALTGDVLAVADAEGLDRFAVWGHSFGGWIAWMTAAAVPERVPAIVSSGSWDPRPESEEPTEPDPWNEVLRQVAAHAPELWDEGIPDRDLRSFPAPALLIAGELEDPDDDAANVAAMIPKGAESSVPGLGHGGALAASALTVPAARALL